MARQTHLSRLNPSYLAARHAGAFFLFLTLGLACGMIWRCLLQPTRYAAEAEVPFSLSPPPPTASFDWDAKAAEWRGILKDPREAHLIGANLRHVLKLAATRDTLLDGEDLAGELLRFEPSRAYPAVILDNRFAARLGPVSRITRRDLAANLDFQSLAAIVADLDPPRDVKDWDFSFFAPGSSGDLRSRMITAPGEGDRFFRVFYHLHGILYPDRPTPSPENAWRAAVDELADRLDREARFPGGGGFGHNAKQELVREIRSLPALVANRLHDAPRRVYDSGGLRSEGELRAEYWSKGASLEPTSRGIAGGVLRAVAETDLFPLAFPRDTVLTRLPPLTAATLVAYAVAREKPTAPSVTVSAIIPAIDPLPELAEPPPPSAPIPAVVPAPDASVIEATAKWRSRIGELEKAARKARLDRDSALRRMEAARDRESRLAADALAARARADRLRERHDAAETQPRDEDGTTISLETAKLIITRDAVRERLAKLLQSCTDEHPFVRETRRELAAIESLLAREEPMRLPERDADTHTARLSALRLEWETASAAADGLDERRRRQAAEMESALVAVTAAELALSGGEAELDRVRMDAPPQPAANPTANVTPPQSPTQPTDVRARPETTQPPETPAKLVFAAPTILVPMTIQRPNWEAPLLGVLLGAMLGLVWALAGELLAFKFSTPLEAGRMVGYPLLASLPAYDAAAFRAAAKTVRGEVAGSRARHMVFTPLPVEMKEPQPAAKRGKLTPARRFPRVLPWIVGLIFLGCAVFVYLRSESGIARPGVAFSGELTLPGGDAAETETEREWGDLP